MTLHINTDETARLVKTRECIDVLEQACQALATEEGVQHIRSDLVVPSVPDEDYWLAAMDGAIRPLGVAAICLPSDHERAVRHHNTPSAVKYAQRPGLFCGLVILYRFETAEPLAIINDGYLQVMRVGATSALAGKYLARPNSSLLGIIGASNQARGHARAYATFYPLELVKVCSRTPQEREPFADDMSEELGAPFRVEGTAREAVEGSGIVAACTSSRVPVLGEEWIGDGSFTSSVRYVHEIRPQNVQPMDVHVVHPATHAPLYRAGSPQGMASVPQCLSRREVGPSRRLSLLGGSGRWPEARSDEPRAENFLQQSRRNGHPVRGRGEVGLRSSHTTTSRVRAPQRVVPAGHQHVAREFFGERANR